MVSAYPRRSGTMILDFTYTRAEVPALATLHTRAFPGFFLSGLGPRFLSQLYLGYISDPTAVISVARGKRGEIIGACVGTTEPSGFFYRLLRRQVLGFCLASVLAIVANPAALPRLIGAVAYRGDSPSGTDGALLSSLCVAPEAQGEGVGRALDESWRATAAALGAPRAFLTTDAHDNEAVIRFYERGGWVLHDQFVTRQGRRMNRLRHDLAPSRAGDTE
jgi:ribosomal protein S18 acetylase RimI-like enzyme